MTVKELLLGWIRLQRKFAKLAAKLPSIASPEERSKPRDQLRAIETERWPLLDKLTAEQLPELAAELVLLPEI